MLKSEFLRTIVNASAGAFCRTIMDSEAAAIDTYIAASSPAAQPVLRRIREIVRSAAPDAEEIISYRMPAFRSHGILIYFAAFKNHIGIFPPIEGNARLDEALARYRGPKGNLRFPFDEPIPYDLIERLVRLRVKQDQAKSTSPKQKKHSRT
jgi:uncharacterized protein YdhG (YjbR/CyaY superfamily)